MICNFFRKKCQKKKPLDNAVRSKPCVSCGNDIVYTDAGRPMSSICPTCISSVMCDPYNCKP